MDPKKIKYFYTLFPKLSLSFVKFASIGLTMRTIILFIYFIYIRYDLIR